MTAAPRDQGALVQWQRPLSNGGSPVTGYVITVSPGGQTVATAAVTSFLVGGLANGTAYQFTVAAVNASGQGPASSPSVAVTPAAPTVPGKVRSVTAVAGFGQAPVSWVAPKSNGGAPVTAYRLTTIPKTTTSTVTGDARSAVVGGLSDGTAYQVLVAAVNSVGRGVAGRSASVTPQVTVPGPPVGVTAAPVSSGVEVSWQSPLSDGGAALSGYVVTVTGTSQTVTVAASTTSTIVTGLTSGTSYTFQVAASNAQGQGPAQTSPPATADGSVGSATVVLSDASLAALTQAGTDGSLVFTSPPAQVLNLAPGDIVVAGVSAATPAGLLAKVTSVSVWGSTVTVDTTAAALDDALAAAGFGTSATLTQGQVARFVPARRGVRLLSAAARPASAPVGSISLSLDTTLYQSADGRQVTVNGSVTLAPSVSFAAQVSCCTHTASQFTGSVTATASLSVTAQVSHDISGGYTLGTFDFAPITVDVLGVPVVIVPQLALKLTAKGSVTAGVTAGAGESVTIGAQVTTQDSQVTAAPFTTRTTSYTPPTLYGSLQAAGGVEADLSATVDGILGVTLADTLWLAELSADPSQTPWWTLSLENVVDVSFDLSLLDQTLASYQKTLSDTTVRLAQAPNPYQAITITPDPAAVTPGGTLQLSAQVARVAAQNVTWSASAGNGTITATGLYTAPSSPGTYQVTATQPPSGLNPGAAGLISIQAGDQPPSPPTGPAATSTSYGQATITWTPPSDTGGGAITGYTITASPGGATQQAPGSATGAAMTGLTPSASYTFTVTATTDGGTSLPSPATSPVVIDNVQTAGGWTATQAPLPADAAANPGAFLHGAACPSDCVVVGKYNTSSSDHGLLLTGSGSSWTAAAAPLPGNGVSSPGVSQVACPSPTACAAIGTYRDASGDTLGLLLTGAGSSWTATQAPLPADAATNPNVNLESIACASPAVCAAVGTYIGSGASHGLLLTLSGTSWTAAEVPVPGGAASASAVSITCPSTSECIAVGSSRNSSGLSQPLILTGLGSSWSLTQPPLPPDSYKFGNASLSSVTCPDATSCVAVGGYQNAAESPSAAQGLIETGLDTSWAATAAPMPANTAEPEGLYQVACFSSSACLVLGSYQDSAGSLLGWLVTGGGTSWTATQAPVPADAATNPNLFLNSATCQAECVVAGTYNDSSNTEQGILVTGSGSSWAATKAPMPTGAIPGNDFLGSVTCDSQLACLVTGYYSDSSHNVQGWLISGTG